MMKHFIRMSMVFGCVVALGVLAMNVPAHAQDDASVLGDKQGHTFSVNITSPILLEWVKTQDQFSNGFTLNPNLYWQNGVQVKVDQLVKTQTYCKIELNSKFVSENPTAAIEKANLLVESVSGRLSKNSSFVTILTINEDVKDIEVLTLSCFTPKESPHELDEEELATITGGQLVLERKLAFKSSNEAAMLVSQMMVTNTKGMAEFKKAHKIGPIVEKYLVEVISDERVAPRTNKSVARYTIESRDCFGTDACKGTVIWVVTETTISDGYSYSTTYENTVTHSK